MEPTDPTEHNMYNILTIDGGGILGIIPAKILDRLSSQNAYLEKIDLFAGTSTGGILAAALAAKIPTDKIVSIYKDEGDDIFRDRGFWDIISFDEMVRANYSSNGLYKILKKYFGSKKYKECETRCLIASFDLEKSVDGMPNHARPKFFDSHDENDGELQIIDIAMMTSAAPTFFPTYNGFADGVLAANNPSDSAIAFAMNQGKKREEIKLLSFGTGFQPFVVKDRNSKHGHDWGLCQWGPIFLQLFINGSNITSDYRSKQFLAENYLRINPLIKEDLELDSINEIDYMLKVADSFELDNLLKWVGEETKGAPE